MSNTHATEPMGGQVSVVEHADPGFGPEPDWGDGPASYPPGEAPRAGGDRTPPQDNAAEQSVLGSMLLSKDAIADVNEILRGTDFYRPAHEVVHDAIVDLYGRGEPADPVTVAAELQRRGELARVGGAPYLHTLSANVPIAANAGYYAEIVREKAILRRLVEAGTKIVQIGYAGEGQVDDVVDQAQAEVYKITEKRTAEDYAPLSDIMHHVLDEIEAIGNREAGLYGVPSGFADFDDLTNGLHNGQMIIVAARPGVGKALALDTPLPTPGGWTTMGEVRVGDELYGADGQPVRVVAATEVMRDRECFEVVFGDGTSIVADAEHQWVTESRESRRNREPPRRVRTTAELARTLRAGSDQRVNHSITNVSPLQGGETAMPIPAYALGAWLGAGHSASARLTSETSEIPMYIEAAGLRCIHRGATLYSISIDDESEGIAAPLRKIGVLGNKHIPTAYLRASEADRRALLAGLLDTDGTVVRASGAVQLGLASRRLADDAYELIVSLGYRCHRRTKRVKGRSDATSTFELLTFSAIDDVFRLHRKAVLHKELRPTNLARIGQRYVVDVRPVSSVPVRCVQVDADDHLYLAGRSMVPTHNSTLALDFCRAASIHNNLASVFFSLEMNRSEITMRLLSAEAKVPLNHIRTGQMTDDDWARLARKMGEVESAPMFIDDSPNMTMMEIRAKARRLKQKHDLRLIVIDYMQLMTSGKKVESRQLEVSEFSRQIKLLAKELEVPIIALSQLNRGPEQRSDKRPMISDLRESGCLTADTRLMRADTNAEITLGELLASGARDVPVWSLDDRLKLVPRTLTHAFPSGTKPVFELTLASGRRVTATGNHKFLTLDGWMPLAELAQGSRIASLRHAPPPLQTVRQDDDEVVLLAHLLGDGSFVRRQPIRYASIDEANLEAVAVAGSRSHEKFVPDWVFGLPKEQVGLFLRHIWATDGSIGYDEKRSRGRVYYASTSRRLVDDLARLLLRFNVFTRIKRVRKPGHRDSFHLHVYGAGNQLRFCDEIGVHGARGETAAALSEKLRDVRADTNLEAIPTEVWGRVREVLAEQQLSHRAFAAAMGTQFCGSTLRSSDLGKHAPSRERMARVAGVLGDADLEVLATNDVYWDSITSIEPQGEQAVYDATVLGTHNFVVEGIAAHNSLEQDADMVILLHREDMYEKESPRAGEADLIVAKHRNGPTRDLVVAFQGHYSRFVDMAH